MLKRAQFLKWRTKLQFSNDFLRAVHFIIFIWCEYTSPQILISKCGKSCCDNVANVRPSVWVFYYCTFTVESFLWISQKHGSSLSLSLSQTFRKYWKAPAWVSDVFRRNRKRKLRSTDFYSIWNIQWNHTLGTHRPNIFPISNKFNGQPMNAFHKDIDVKFCF